MKAFRASSKHGSRTDATPRAAAIAFFTAFPKARKCDVHEGETDGHFFTVRLALGGGGSRRWTDVSPRLVAELPQQ